MDVYVKTKLRLDRIEQDRIVFDTILDNGVCYTPQEMLDIVEKICKKYNRNVLWPESGGDFSYTWFYVEPEFSEEEAEEIEMKWNKL